MRPLSRTYFACAAAITLVWLTIGVLVRTMSWFPVSLATVVPLLIEASFWRPWGLVGLALHVTLFLVVNAYLLNRRTPPGAVRAWLPSLAALFLLTVATAPYGFAFVKHGLRYQGLVYVVAFGLLHLGALGGLLSFAVVRLQRAVRTAERPDEQVVLRFNFAMQLAAVLALFPYAGEMP